MAETVPALALRRCAAYGLDYLGYAAIASAGVPVGIVLLRNNVQLSPAQLAVISSVARDRDLLGGEARERGPGTPPGAR